MMQITKATPKWQTEFPDFPAADMPAVPAELMDTSWHNDACPSFTSDAMGLQLFVDYADKELREFQDGARFILSPQDHGVETSGEPYLATDSWDDVIAAIKQHIVSRIAELRPRAETGEQWANICALESAYVAITGEQLP